MHFQPSAQLLLWVNKVGLGTDQLHKTPVPAMTCTIKGFAAFFFFSRLA